MEIDYQNSSIFITSDNPAENEQLMSCFNSAGFFSESNKIKYQKDGRWQISPVLLDRLNIALIPMKQSVRLTNTFKNFLKEVRNSKPIHDGSEAEILVGVVETKIIPHGQDIPYDKLQKKMRYFFEGAKNSKAFKEGKWDGYFKLFNKVKKTFPTGLLFDATDILDKSKVKYRLKMQYDAAPPAQFSHWTINDGIIPDDDQIEAVKKAVAGRRGIVKAPTGFGKTAVLAKRLVAAHKVPTLFIANKKMLLDDAAEEFLNGIDGLEDVEAIKDGWFGHQKINKETIDVKPLSAPVVVATIQSLHARLADPRTAAVLKDWLNNVCKFVMVDECQAVGSKMWDDVLNEIWAPYRIMLSATPRRTDGATIKIRAASGPVLFETNAETQIEKGRLCELEVRMVKFDQKLYNEKDQDLQYDVYYKQCIVYNEERNNLLCDFIDELVAEDRNVLVLVVAIDHGRILKEILLKRGYTEDDVRMVWGDTPNKKRQEAIDDFRKGKYKVLIGSTIFDAGANIPGIAGVVLAGAGAADITLIQRIGRAARNCDYQKAFGRIPKFMKGLDKKKSIIYDILDVNAKFFRKQARLRYENASSEFGKERVRLINATTSDFRVPSSYTRPPAAAESMKFSVGTKQVGLEELKKMFE